MRNDFKLFLLSMGLTVLPFFVGGDWVFVSLFPGFVTIMLWAHWLNHWLDEPHPLADKFTEWMNR
jgi:hypothetical protein